MTGSQIYSAAWRLLIILFTVQITLTSVARYFTFREEAPPPILANAFAHPFLAVHVFFAMIALVAGPFQFVRLIRQRWPALHRLSGRLYVLGCAIGAPTGIVLALGATAGPMVNIGFAIPGLLCTLYTWLGWRAVMERRFADHENWMLRSYAMIAGAITLRLLIPASAWLGFDFLAAYRVNAWLAWMINLALAEIVIRRRGPSAKRHGLVTA